MSDARETYFALVISESLGAVAAAKYVSTGLENCQSADEEQFIVLEFADELVGYTGPCVDGILLPVPGSFELRKLNFTRPVKLEDYQFNDYTDDENGSSWLTLKGVNVAIENSPTLTFKVDGCPQDLNVTDITRLFVCKASDQGICGNDVIQTVFDEFRAKSGSDTSDIEMNCVEIETFNGIPQAVVEMRRKFENALAQLKEFEDRATAANFSDPAQEVRLYWDINDDELVMETSGDTSGISSKSLAYKLGSHVMENIYKQVKKLKLLTEQQRLQQELAKLNATLDQ